MKYKQCCLAISCAGATAISLSNEETETLEEFETSVTLL
jgi:hypothetical protein